MLQQSSKPGYRDGTLKAPDSLAECRACDLLGWRHPHCGYPKEGNVTPTTCDDKQNKEVTGELVSLEHKCGQIWSWMLTERDFRSKGRCFRS